MLHLNHNDVESQEKINTYIAEIKWLGERTLELIKSDVFGSPRKLREWIRDFDGMWDPKKKEKMLEDLYIKVLGATIIKKFNH